MSATYVLRLPKHIEKMIQNFVLGYGTKLCQLMRATLLGMPKEDPDFTLWRLHIRQRGGQFLCKSYSSIAKCELRLLYLIMEKDNLPPSFDLQYEIDITELSIRSRVMLMLSRLVRSDIKELDRMISEKTEILFKQNL